MANRRRSNRNGNRGTRRALPSRYTRPPHNMKLYTIPENSPRSGSIENAQARRLNMLHKISTLQAHWDANVRRAANAIARRLRNQALGVQRRINEMRNRRSARPPEIYHKLNYFK